MFVLPPVPEVLGKYPWKCPHVGLLSCSLCAFPPPFLGQGNSPAGWKMPFRDWHPGFGPGEDTVHPTRPTADRCVVISPQELSNHLLGEILPKSTLAGAFTCCSIACRGPRNKWLPGSSATSVPGHRSLCSFLCCARGSGSECFPLLPRAPASCTLFVSERSALLTPS